MALPFLAIAKPVLSIVSTGFSIAWTYLSGKLRRQKSQLESNREARKIDSEVDGAGADAARDSLLARRRDSDGG